MDDFTRKFDFVVDQDAEIHRIMLAVYTLIRKVDRDELMQILVRNYLAN